LKSNIVIASVLKPVNDPRMYEKIGLSLAQHFPQTNLHLIAFASLPQAQASVENIRFYPIFDFKRLQVKRMLANFLLFRLLLKIKPNILIISTFELIPSALFYKWFFGKKLIYDVQENYFYNLKYTRVFPPIVRDILAFMVRGMEWVASRWIDEYWLAEKCYEKELIFLNQKAIILENKFIQPIDNQIVTKKSKTKIQNFIYTGTISADYGIFEAIELIKKLHLIDNQINLKIMGYCAKQVDLIKIQQLIDNQPFIQLIGGEKPLAHTTILAAIAQADMALLPYRLNKCFENRIPTKFFEYLHFRLPMLVSKNEAWEKFYQNYPFYSAIFLDFNDLDTITHLYQQIQSIRFYETEQDIQDIYWQSEEVKLIEAMNQFYFK
jgi:glycosyltransferase involved in cell wall biosynthesis